MNIRMKTMMGTHHSWSVVARSLASSFLKLDQNLFLESINGHEGISDDLMKYFDLKIFSPDIDLAYTLPKNFEKRFLTKSKTKIAIYNYDSDILPSDWSDLDKHVDWILPSSNYSKEIFLKSGWDEKKLVVVPHGVSYDDFNKYDGKCEDIDDNYFNFLNISIPHYRKNLDLLVLAYYLEFEGNDNVCLNIKTTIKKPEYYFEFNFLEKINDIQKSLPGMKLPKVNILTSAYDSMIPLYNSSDCYISTTSFEGFGMTLLEAMFSGLLVIAPHQTGQKDFLNSKNSLEIEGKVGSSPKEYQYWKPSHNSKTFFPSVDSIRKNMRMAYENNYTEKTKMAYIDSSKYTWDNAAKKILDLKDG